MKIRPWKRVFDLSVGTLIFLLISPLYLFCVLLVWLTYRRPVHFRQHRIGYGNKPFKMYKFRTMNQKCDDHGNFLPDEDRLTVVGRFLRKTSLDELPQLLNVLRGDMSLVGPRPQLERFTANCTEEELQRFEVLPGITGWAQVGGRNAIGWKEKFKLDLWYVEHQSLSVDLMILMKTIPTVLSRRGIDKLREDKTAETVKKAEVINLANHLSKSTVSEEKEAVSPGESDKSRIHSIGT